MIALSLKIDAYSNSFSKLSIIYRGPTPLVVDARHKFARKRYFDKNRWEPTDEIVAAIAEAIFGKLI